MRRTGWLLVVLLAGVGLAAPARAQEAPTEVGGPEATRNVATAAQWRQALTALSAVTSGTSTINLTADIEFNTDTMPTYTGSRPLVVEGQDHTIDGNLEARIVHVTSTAKVTFRDAVLVDGLAAVDDKCGGLIRSAGNVVVEDSSLLGGKAVLEGAGICADGNVTVTRSELSANVNLGNGVYVGSLGGGAISVGGNLTIRDSNLLGNRTGGDGGGAVYAHGGTVTIERSNLTDNHVMTEDGVGGALLLAGDGAATIVDSEIGGNDTQRGPGGAIYAGSNVELAVAGGIFSGNVIEETITTGLTNGGGAIQAEAPIQTIDVQFRNNEAQRAQGGALNLQQGGTILGGTFFGNRTTGPVTGRGGAIYSADGLVVTEATFEQNTTAASTGDGGALAIPGGTIHDSYFVDNSATAADGGAIESIGGGQVEVVGSELTTNEAGGDGGAIAAEDLTLDDSALWANDAGDDGGAVFVNHEGDLTNVTLARNRATGSGAGLWADGGSEAALTHVTLAGNDATAAGDHLASAQDVVWTIGATVVDAPASGASCSYGATNTVTSTGYGIDTGTSCRFDAGTDQESTDPQLGDTHRVGGGGVAHVPLAASPAVDLVPSGSCAVDHDQQGVERPFDEGCDSGAVERLFPDGPFTDLPAWITDAGRWLTWTGNSPQIMVGITPTTFEPGENITRAQVVRMLYNLAGAPDASGYPAHGFTDVPAWVESAVRWAKGEGIVEGITPTTFVPDDPITRAQVVRMLHRFADSPPITGIDPHPFTDVPAWVQEAVTWAANSDLALPIFTGITATTFVPDDPITRGQVARSTYRLSLTPEAWADADQAPSQVIFRPNIS